MSANELIDKLNKMPSDIRKTMAEQILAGKPVEIKESLAKKKAGSTTGTTGTTTDANAQKAATAAEQAEMAQRLKKATSENVLGRTGARGVSVKENMKKALLGD